MLNPPIDSPVDPAQVPPHPAFAPYRPLLSALGRGSPDHGALNRLARSLAAPPASALGAPIRFVHPAHHASALAYEQRILERGEVATREGDWHDFFNALVWMAFPRTKAALNATHCVDGTAAAGTRSRCRDALTLLDESGMLIRCSDPSLIARWREHAWREVFWDARDEVIAAFALAVIGHGLLVKLLKPYRGITAKVLVVAAANSTRDNTIELDAAAASEIAAVRNALTPDALLPLPVAALPGWDAERLDAALFDDVSVFRPRG
jgi:Protein of unknown function (DUF3025)